MKLFILDFNKRLNFVFELLVILEEGEQKFG